MSALMLLRLNLRFLPGRFGANVKNEDPMVFKKDRTKANF